MILKFIPKPKYKTNNIIEKIVKLTTCQFFLYFKNLKIII